VKVSAIVPVYNPGSNIDDCIESLLGQSLPQDDYEVIFVDDGSTDATPARLDALAGEHPHVRVEHIPNSGWPGRPRNVGIDMARGEFVYFVDNDDWIERDALERMHAAAVSHDADVVVGKVVGHGKYVPRGLFKETRHGETLEWPGLLGLLTPHKLFRKSLLDDNGIRFPEGRRRLEDHVFVMHAYFHARGVSVLADRPAYHWMLRRDQKSNASYQAFDAAGYYENVREVLDLIEEHTEPGPLRDRLLSHWYRGKMLGRVGGRYFPRRDPEQRRTLYDEVRKLALERYGPEVDAWIKQSMRVRSHLLREGTYESLEKLAEMEAELRAVTTVQHARWEDDGTFVLPFEARLVERHDRPLRFERRSDRIFWVPPELPDELPERVLEVTDDLFKSTVQIILRAKRGKAEFVLPSQRRVKLVEVDGQTTALLTGEARIEPGKAAAGAKLPRGRWEVLAALDITGFQAVGKVRSRRTDAEYELRINDEGAVPQSKRRRRAKAESARPASLKGRLARKMPRLARRLRRAREGRRAAAAG
jgi:glycosyltransferase involved in cell wall biosynthesis